MECSTRALDTAAERKRPAEGHKAAPRTPVRREPPAREGAARTGIARRLRADKSAYAALVMLSLIVIGAVFAPLLSPFSPAAIDPASKLLAPSALHPFGTDDMGRDLFVRVLHGGRVSVAVGFVGMFFAVFIGMIGGGVAGYYGGIPDYLVMRFADVMLSIPVFLILLLFSSLVSPGFVLLCLLIGSVQWMEVARVVRTVAVSTRELEFVSAARALGVPDARVLLRHLLPHSGAAVFVAGTLALGQAIVIESTLSFLGFGVQPPSTSWGALLNDAQGYLGTAPWNAVFPGLMIFATVLCCYVLGGFLKSTLDPRGAFPRIMAPR
jgi:peptide/nickel transport system permease protein